MPREKQYQESKEPELKIQESLQKPEPIILAREVVTNKEKFSNLVDDLGFISVVSAVPTHVPTHPLNKIVLYVNGATKRIYYYDTANKAWYYSALT